MSRMVRTISDLDRVARTLALHFKTNRVFIIGSQSILTGWPDAPEVARMSAEVDAYPGNAKAWEALPENQDLEASEEINVLFGAGSQFERQHGFYIDGVDERTAILPADWQIRAVKREINGHDGKVTIIAPSILDIAVSKLARLADKDREWLAAVHRARPFDIARLANLAQSAGLAPELRRAAIAFVQELDG